MSTDHRQPAPAAAEESGPEPRTEWLPGVPLSAPAKVLQGVLLLLGIAGIVFGVFVFFTDVPKPYLFHWTRAIRWGIAGLLINDLVLAPAAVVLGFLLLRRLPVRQQPVARGVLLGLVCLALFVIISAGAQMRQQNPTVVVNSPIASALAGLAVLLIGVLLAEVVLLIKNRRRSG